MSLKTNESTQKKKKSLRDLFGDNLTETGKADLERAGELAAQDLARVIFSEKFVSTETEMDSGSVHTPGSKSIESGVYWSGHIASPSSSREVGYNLAMKWGAVPVTLRTDIKDAKYFKGKALNSEQMKAVIDSMVRNMNELANRESFLIASDHSEGFHSVTGLKQSTLKVSGLDGEEYVTFLPLKLKEDRMRLLPQTSRLRRRQLAHKVK
ncbi:hypothetical protein [Citrobacter freundii]|uniref:hypothetical protein n=1 Tax=Citrobacter freundii TaxID=546 RepID=UPI00397CDCAC